MNCIWILLLLCCCGNSCGIGGNNCGMGGNDCGVSGNNGCNDNHCHCHNHNHCHCDNNSCEEEKKEKICDDRVNRTDFPMYGRNDRFNDYDRRDKHCETCGCEAES